MYSETAQPACRDSRGPSWGAIRKARLLVELLGARYIRSSLNTLKSGACALAWLLHRLSGWSGEVWLDCRTVMHFPIWALNVRLRTMKIGLLVVAPMLSFAPSLSAQVTPAIVGDYTATTDSMLVVRLHLRLNAEGA